MVLFRCEQFMAIHFSPFSLICGPPWSPVTTREISHARTTHFVVIIRFWELFHPSNVCAEVTSITLNWLGFKAIALLGKYMLNNFFYGENLIGLTTIAVFLVSISLPSLIWTDLYCSSSFLVSISLPPLIWTDPYENRNLRLFVYLNVASKFHKYKVNLDNDQTTNYKFVPSLILRLLCRR